MTTTPSITHDRRGDPVQPTGDMRERLAAALLSARPSHYDFGPDHAYNRFLWQNKNERAMYEKWADQLLVCFDRLSLGLIDTTDERR